MSINPHEEQLIKNFFLPQRQARYLDLFARPRRRQDVRRVLGHFKHIDRRWASAIPSNCGSAESIAKLLFSKGASSRCWALSEATELDGKEVNLRESLEFIVGREIGTFLSCLPGQLAYFESEDDQWILERRPSR